MARKPRAVHPVIDAVRDPRLERIQQELEQAASQPQPSELRETELVPADASAEELIQGGQRDSLAAWFSLYLGIEVGAPEEGEKPSNTFTAKRADLERFLDYFLKLNGGLDEADRWTKSTSEKFRKDLVKSKSKRTGKPFAAATNDRLLATLRHVSKWIHHRRPFTAGPPMGEGNSKVKDTQQKRRPAWRGLPENAEARLRSASDQLIKINTRANQRPLRNHALLFVGLNSALRPSEILNLDLAQFEGKALLNVRCKGNQVVTRVPLGKNAIDALNDYIDGERGEVDGPLFQSKTGRRLTLQKYNDAMKAIAAMANRGLPEDEKIRISPHDFRHHSLKKLAQEKGIAYAHKRSNHISNEHIFRYLEPDDKSFDEAIEDH